MRVVCELLVTRELAEVSEVQDGERIFSAVFAVSLGFCSKSSLTFNENAIFLIALLYLECNLLFFHWPV